MFPYGLQIYPTLDILSSIRRVEKKATRPLKRVSGRVAHPEFFSKTKPPNNSVGGFFVTVF